MICLQETWLSDDSDTALFQLNDYTLLSKGKSCSVHRGTALYIHNSIYFKELYPDVTSTLWDGLFVELSLEIDQARNQTFYEKIVICNMYRPPRSSIDNLNSFIDDMSNIFQTFERTSNILIVGDFNIDILKFKQNSHINNYLENILSSGFLPNITFPTRLTSCSGSLIDNIFSKSSGKLLNIISGILLNQISDHLPCFIAFELSGCRKYNSISQKIIRLNTHNSYMKFKADLQSLEFTNILDNIIGKDVDESYKKLNDALQLLINKHFPKKVVKFNKHKHRKAKWMTNGILRSISFRDRLYLQFKKTPLSSDDYFSKKINLNSFNKILKQCIRNAKNIYYEKCFNDSKNDIKKTWLNINSILCRQSKSELSPKFFLINGNNISNYNIIVNEFNKYYTEIGPKLASNISIPENQCFKNCLPLRQSNTYHFKSVSDNDIIKVIDSLKLKTSYGIDQISNKLLKYLKNELSSPISRIINQCFLTGVFPEKLKIAKVIPLYKKKDKTLLENYRPVSILSSVSKVFERTMYNQIYQYFSDNKLFYQSQYGFRQNHSTEFATIELVDRLISEMENNEIPLNIYLDLSKAFDTLDHAILLEKLKHYGIKDRALDLLESYLTNRQQYVHLNDTTSDLLPIITGVPQGSILGPLLFIIYVNDLSNASNFFYPIIYADDTTLMTTLKTITLHDINNDINRIINNELY